MNELRVGSEILREGSVRPATATTGTTHVIARARAWALCVWAVMLGWGLAMFLVVRERHEDIRFARYDLGNMVQAVWSTAQGRPLEVTDGATGEQVVRLAFHADPFLALLAPLWTLVPSPLTLIAVQVAGVTLGALPVFWLARRHSQSERDAAILAFGYLAYPWIAWAAGDAFHSVSLVIPLFLFCVWFLDTDRLLPFALCAGLALSTGELMGLVVASLGVWYALARGRKRAGAIIAATGLAWTLLAVYVIVPAFAGGPSAYYAVFENVGGSPTGVIRTAFTDPLAIVAAMTGPDDLMYLFLLAAPVAGTFLLAPGVAALASIPLALNLVAGGAGTGDPHEHYVSGVLPFLFAATAIGVARLAPLKRTRTAVMVLVASLAATVAGGPWPGAILGAPAWDPLPTSDEYVETLATAIALVPEDAAVSTTNRAGSHLAARRYFYSVPIVRRADWVVIESRDVWIPRRVSGESDPEAIQRLLVRLERSSEWEKVLEERGIFVFRRFGS